MNENINNIKIIKSKRKSFSLEIKPSLEIICRAPLTASTTEINEFIQKHKKWLESNIKKLDTNISSQPLGADELKALSKRAKQYIPQRVEFFANQLGVKYGNVTIRTQKTRWGSCSSKGNLNFNCLLMLTDIEIIDYVVVHELCHLKQMNHSSEFWAQVEKVIPDYKQRRKSLKQIEQEIMSRAHNVR